MYTQSDEKDDESHERVSVSEANDAYEYSERFMRNKGGNEVKITVEEISDFIYRVYPTFFLQGLKYMGRFYIMTGGDLPVESKNLSGHHPTRFSRIRMSMFVRKLMRDNDWSLTDTDIAQIVLTCASDFSEDYMEFFPYTVRVFTGNEDKRRAYRTAFDGKPVQFCVYEFIEPQASDLEIVNSKMADIEESHPESNELIVVDDTGVSLYALRGNPGSYVKPFLQQMTCDQVAQLLSRVKEKRGHLDIMMGMSYVYEGHRKRLVLQASFPITWEHQVGMRDQGFDGSLRYNDAPILSLRESPHQILLEWMWHRFKRRMDLKV
jgi:inosine/xanthosine triphosphate pyrophosphatase family protein